MIGAWRIRLAGILLAAAGCRASEPSGGPFSPPTSASAGGAAPMILVTPEGDRVLAWVANDPRSGREALHLEVVRTGSPRPEPTVS